MKKRKLSDAKMYQQRSGRAPHVLHHTSRALPAAAALLAAAQVYWPWKHCCFENGVLTALGSGVALGRLNLAACADSKAETQVLRGLLPPLSTLIESLIQDVGWTPLKSPGRMGDQAAAATTANRQLGRPVFRDACCHRDTSGLRLAICISALVQGCVGGYGKSRSKVGGVGGGSSGRTTKVKCEAMQLGGGGDGKGCDGCNSSFGGGSGGRSSDGSDA